MTPKQRPTPIAAPTPAKKATSMPVLMLAWLLGACLGGSLLMALGSIGYPAMTLGVIGFVVSISALVKGGARFRKAASVGLLASLWLMFVVHAQKAADADREAKEAQDRVDAQQRQEWAQAARQKAEAAAPKRIEDARAAAATGNVEAVVQSVEWLRGSGLDVPKDVRAVFAKDRLAKAKAAVAERRWEDARKLAGEAKGADAAMDSEAAQVFEKATASIDKAAASERAATEKAAAAEQAATEKAAAAEERGIRAEHEKAMATARTGAAEQIEYNMLKSGMEARVRATGTNGTVLSIEWAGCGRSTLVQLLEGTNWGISGRDKVRALGFKKAQCVDGNGGGAWTPVE